ncbi:MAG TPA: hypothetical protein VMH79_06035 [Thermoanaerobaculia bacterium]|nr:hypothetical protein [Thermoanaerobaculia bacterium]
MSAALIFAACACASAPRPSAATRRIAANPPAVIEGRVVDPFGKPAAGVGVRGIPRGQDIPWSTPAKTDCDGRFRVSVPAPAAYAFLLSWKETSVMTPSPEDPAMEAVPVTPGGQVSGVVLVFDAAAWRQATSLAPLETPSCP